MIFLLLVLRNRNFYSREQFFDKFYLFAKLCVVSLIYQGENYLIMGYYLIGCFMLWIFN